MSDCKRCGTRFITEDHAEWCPGPDRNPELPRRIRTDRWTPAEHAIGGAMEAVEAAGADVALTDAVVLLQAARERVADFVDGVEGTRMVPRPYIESPSPVPPSAPDDARPAENEIELHPDGSTYIHGRPQHPHGQCSYTCGGTWVCGKCGQEWSGSPPQHCCPECRGLSPLHDARCSWHPCAPRSPAVPPEQQPPSVTVSTVWGCCAVCERKRFMRDLMLACRDGEECGIIARAADVQPAAAPVNAPVPLGDEAMASAKKPEGEPPAAAPAPPAWPQGVNDAHAVWHPGWRKDCALCAPAVPSVPVGDLERAAQELCDAVGDLEGTPIDYRIAMRLGKAARALRSLIQGGGR